MKSKMNYIVSKKKRKANASWSYDRSRLLLSVAFAHNLKNSARDKTRTLIIEKSIKKKKKIK